MVWPFPGQLRLGFVPVFHCLQGRPAVQDGLRELLIIQPDLAVRRCLQLLAGAEMVALRYLFGQDIFRAGLIEYWQGRCPLTGIADTALLRAPHIVPWRECESDAERLDMHNGLLLSALWDAAFDRGLVTLNDDGRPQFSPSLSDAARAELRWQDPVPLTDRHRKRLAWHREHLFVS